MIVTKITEEPSTESQLSMSQFQDAVLESIVQSGKAWLTPNEICNAVQCPPDVVNDCLADLESSDRISTWEADPKEGLVVTLTPYGAACLKVHLINDYKGCHWAPLHETDKTPQVASGVFRGERAAKLDLVIANSPSAEELAITTEDISVISAMPAAKREKLAKTLWQGKQRFDESALPYPTVFLGSGSALWDNVHHAICPACKNRDLQAYEYCLRCDRWGMDGFVEPPTTPPVRLRGYDDSKAKAVNMARRIAEKEKRKAKRMERLGLAKKRS